MAAEIPPRDRKIEELVDLAEKVVNSLSESYKNNPANFNSPKAGKWWEAIHMPADRPIRPEKRKKYKLSKLAKSSAKRELSLDGCDESVMEAAHCVMPVRKTDVTGGPGTVQTVAEVIPYASWMTSLQGQGGRYGDDGAYVEGVKCTLIALVETTFRVPTPTSTEEEETEGQVARVEDLVNRSFSESRGNRTADDTEPWWMKEISWYEHPTEQSVVDPNCLMPLWRKWAPQHMWQRYQDRLKRRRNVRRRMRPLVLPENPTSAQKLYHEVYEEDRIFRLLKDASPRTYAKLMKDPMYYNYENPTSDNED